MQIFSQPRSVFTVAILLHAILLVYGFFRDAYSPMKYTDIDYFVFTDAARFLAHGQSPYTRDTYRYTPLLAWLLYPTTWSGFWFSFGKALFALSDVVAGWLIYKILRSSQSMSQERASKFASIWLLNPMVAQISTRGSSEGLLCVNVIALLWAIQSRKIKTAGILLGLGVHLKIYPFIYGASIVWWLDDQRVISAGKRPQTQSKSLITAAMNFLNVARIQFVAYSLITFALLSGAMFIIYGNDFLQHTYLYHFTRIDHRHNFSPYNILLYLNSSPSGTASFRLESLAFIPQLLFSTILIPLATAKRDLPSTMLAQTFAFVTFNKVCTSQYFLWYIVFLPFYLPDSTLLQKPRLGLTVTVLWVLGQVAWLQQGYQLEFLGRSTFALGLWLSSIGFYFVNIWILGIIIGDLGRSANQKSIERTQ